MEKRGAKKRVGRPEGKRPVIAMRIDPDLYKKLAQSAAKRKIPIAADAANRLEQSFQWDQTAEGQKKLVADHQDVIAKGKEAAMQEWRIQPVVGRDGLFVDIDKIKPHEMVALNPALESLIEQVVLRTLEKARQS